MPVAALTLRTASRRSGRTSIDAPDGLIAYVIVSQGFQRAGRSSIRLRNRKAPVDAGGLDGEGLGDDAFDGDGVAVGAGVDDEGLGGGTARSLGSRSNDRTARAENARAKIETTTNAMNNGPRVSSPSSGRGCITGGGVGEGGPSTMRAV